MTDGWTATRSVKATSMRMSRYHGAGGGHTADECALELFELPKLDSHLVCFAGGLERTHSDEIQGTASRERRRHFECREPGLHQALHQAERSLVTREGAHLNDPGGLRCGGRDRGGCRLRASRFGAQGGLGSVFVFDCAFNGATSRR